MGSELFMLNILYNNILYKVNIYFWFQNIGADSKETTPFDENRNSILEWLSAFLQQYGVGSGSSVYPHPPEPIDQSKCEPCCKCILNI